MGYRSESLIIVVSLLLLKTMSHKTSIVTLERTIRASLNLIDPLELNGTNIGRRGNQIPRASVLERINLLYHCKLPFGMSNNIPTRSRLKNSKKTIMVRGIAIRWEARLSIEVVNRKRQGRLYPISRWHGGRIIHNVRKT